MKKLIPTCPFLSAHLTLVVAIPVFAVYLANKDCPYYGEEVVGLQGYHYKRVLEDPSVRTTNIISVLSIFRITYYHRTVKEVKRALALLTTSVVLVYINVSAYGHNIINHISDKIITYNKTFNKTQTIYKPKHHEIN